MTPLLASIFTLKLWYAVPLIVAVSLVYAATRHEAMQPILLHAARAAVMIVAFMAAIFVVIFAIAWYL